MTGSLPWGRHRPRRKRPRAARGGRLRRASATRSPPTVDRMQRAQGTVEYLGLLAALAVLLGLVALAISADPPQSAGRVCSALQRHARTPDERALRNPVLGALIASAAPSIVLERDVHGDDLAIPVSDACRYPGCAAYGKARCVLYVHVVALERANRARVLDVLPALTDRSPADPGAAGLPSRRLGGPAGGVLGHRPPARCARAAPTSAGTGRRPGGTRPATTGRPTAGSPTARQAAMRSVCDAAISTSPETAGTATSRSSPPAHATCAPRIAPDVAPVPSIPVRSRRGTSRPGAIPAAAHTGPPGSSPGAAAAAARAWGVGVDAARVGVELTRLGALPL